MKIAYIGPTGIFGGVRIIAEHLNRLAERGHECTLLSTTGQPINWLACNFEQVPLDSIFALTVTKAGSYMAPIRQFDAVVGTAIPTWEEAKYVADGNCRVFGLLQMADWLFEPTDSQAQRDMMAQFAAPVEVLAISEWLAKLAETVPGRPVHRIRNGIDTRLFFHDDFPDLPEFDGVTVVTEGYSHNPAKDVDEYFKRAVRHLRWDHGYKIRPIGFSQFEKTFEFDAYWQVPPQYLIRKIYSAGDIFLKASRYEGRPGPHMEAMACGAVVCTAIGTGDDDLVDDFNCLKVPYGDYDGFVANLRRLIDDIDLRVRLREQALIYVKEKYDWDGAIDLVETALTGNATRPDPTRRYDYDLAAYNPMQDEIVGWETPQAMWLGETLAEMLEPKSVIDIGCGPGVYLTPFKPAARVLGIDGAPDAGKCLELYEFMSADFRKDWSLEKAVLSRDDIQWYKDGKPVDGHPLMYFDLALCIEVAEHLPPARADYMVELMTTCADVVFWSAAHPGQGGTLHLNEQEPAWWLEKFRSRGFDLHPLHAKLAEKIKANPACQRVQWLIGNAMLLGRVSNA